MKHQMRIFVFLRVCECIIFSIRTSWRGEEAVGRPRPPDGVEETAGGVHPRSQRLGR